MAKMRGLVKIGPRWCSRHPPDQRTMRGVTAITSYAIIMFTFIQSSNGCSRRATECFITHSGSETFRMATAWLLLSIGRPTSAECSVTERTSPSTCVRTRLEAAAWPPFAGPQRRGDSGVGHHTFRPSLQRCSRNAENVGRCGSVKRH